MSAQKTKYQQVLEYIRNGILNGDYVAGDRLPSDGQLLRQFKTSRPTVARAMRDLEKEGYLERRTGSGSFVTVPSLVKPSLIGLLTPEAGEAELFEPICSEIAVHCQKHNLSLLWAESSGNKTGEAELEKKAYDLCQRYIQMGVAGVFFAPVEFSARMLQVNLDIANRLDSAGISVILLDRDLERMPNRSRFDLIGVNNFRVGMIQANYLIGLGAKRIGYVSRNISAPTIDLRIAGYQHVLKHNQIEHPSPLVFCGDPDDQSFVEEVIGANLDSIICSNDTTAAMLLRSLLRNGVSVPHDIRLIGVDDVKIAKLTSVPLTTVKQPCREMGRAAVVAMVRRIENRKMTPCDLLLDVELIVRDSCGAKSSTQIRVDV